MRSSFSEAEAAIVVAAVTALEATEPTTEHLRRSGPADEAPLPRRRCNGIGGVPVLFTCRLLLSLGITTPLEVGVVLDPVS